MDLELLVISDTHLGEDTSLLSNPFGLQHLWSTLREAFGGGAERSRGPVKVKELILLGDIPDRTLSSTTQIIAATNAFLDTIQSALDVERIVYVPGNHDHTLWTSYRRRASASATTPAAGVSLLRAGVPQGDAASEYLSLFFGWPNGAPARAVARGWKVDFAVANPVYARRVQSAAGDRIYAFAHGTHFRSDVTLPTWTKRLADELQLDWLAGRIEIEPGREAKDATSLADLEERVAPFVDTLWPSSQQNPTSRSDQTWYLLSAISGKFGKHRPAPAASRLYAHADLPGSPPERIHRMTPKGAEADPSIRAFRQHFERHLVSFLAAEGLKAPDLTFVYGDTHNGGFGELTVGDMRARLYNTGAWVVHSADDHPPAHLFAVDTQGNEHLLDVSFRGVGGDPGDPASDLLSLAAADAENRSKRSSLLLRGLLKLLPRP